MKRFSSLSQSAGRVAILAGAVFLAAVTVATNFSASSQELASGDVILARKTLMSVIARNMYPLDEMVYTGKINLQRGRAAADSISAMLQAFPLLFPQSTNTWTPGATADPAHSTFADPHIWDEFNFFYKEAQAASKYALDASRAENDTDFRKSVTQLRQTCDTCHATFQKNS